MPKGANPKYEITRFPLCLGVVRGGGETYLRTVATAFSVVIALLMFAQPVLAEESNTVTVSDVKNDLVMMGVVFQQTTMIKEWPDKSPVAYADYLDVKEASVSKQGDTFVVTMTMWCKDLLAEVRMPIGSQHGKQIAWWLEFVSVVDKSSCYAGVWWNGNEMLPLDLSPNVIWSVEGATITMRFNEDMLGDTSSIQWRYFVMLCLAPVGVYTWGGYWRVDLPDCYSWPTNRGYALWPA